MSFSVWFTAALLYTGDLKRDPYDSEATNISASKALNLAKRLANNPHFGRVWIVDDETDTIPFDWNIKDGVTFPPQEDLPEIRQAIDAIKELVSHDAFIGQSKIDDVVRICNTDVAYAAKKYCEYRNDSKQLLTDIIKASPILQSFFVLPR